MIVVDEPLLKEFRGKRCCEFCGKKGPVDPHHIFSRGMGGGGRLDVRVNLIALCRADHMRVHDGNILRCDILALVAQREQTTQDCIIGTIRELRRKPKGAH